MQQQSVEAVRAFWELSPWFEIQETFLHFFPMRILPLAVPSGVHRLADRYFGFMIYARLHKRLSVRRRGAV